MASHPDMQKIQITGFFFDKRYIGSLQWKNIYTCGCFRLHVYAHTNKTFIHNSLCVINNWGEKPEAIKRYSTITVRKCLPDGPSCSR
jgi:hypothetical protein